MPSTVGENEEEMFLDRNPFLRRQGAVFEALPNTHQGQSIEEIILDSVTERTREFILRRIPKCEQTNT
jgi:hypothetical protein